MMDATWLAFNNYPIIPILCVIPTAVTGIWLFFTEKQTPPILCINIAVNCWIWMNTLWMLNDFLEVNSIVIVAEILMAIGLLAMVMGIRLSRDVAHTLSRFRRLRIRQYIALKKGHQYR